MINRNAENARFYFALLCEGIALGFVIFVLIVAAFIFG